MPKAIDTRKLRKRHGMSRREFGEAFGLARRVLERWEQGARVPSPAAQTLLRVIDREPEAVRRALGTLAKKRKAR